MKESNKGFVRRILEFCHYKVPSYIPKDKKNQRDYDVFMIALWFIYYGSMLWGIYKLSGTENNLDYIIWLISVLPNVCENWGLLVKGKNTVLNSNKKASVVFHREIYSIPLVFEIAAFVVVTIGCCMEAYFERPVLTILIIMLLIQSVIRTLAMIFKADDIY